MSVCLWHFFCCHIYLLLFWGGIRLGTVCSAVVEIGGAEYVLQMREGVVSFVWLQLTLPDNDGVPAKLMELGAGDSVALYVACYLLCPVVCV